MELILASASPRRHQLLGAAGITFRVVVPDCDESVETLESPHALASRLALLKVLTVAVREPDACVLAADTVVVAADGSLLAKAADRAEAARMLARLGTRSHFVTTGVAVRHPDGRTWADSDTSRLTLVPGPYDAYLDSEQWRGKAGAYGIQDRGTPARLEAGRLDTVVGLPVDLATGLLACAGVV